MISNRTIFICPLDWGLGHASRCIPIIHELKKQNTVFIGTTDLNADFFEQYFPDLQKINTPSYAISYSRFLPLWMKLSTQWFRIKKIIALENQLLKKIIEEQKIDLVISDNRFGLFSENVESIFITHQLYLKTPIFSSLANKINGNYIRLFTKVWVPDFENKNERLSGQLSDSEGIEIPVEYIGPQSALSISTNKTIPGKIDYLFLLSGIEPDRTFLEKELLKKFDKSEKKIVLVRGTKNGTKISVKNSAVINFADGDELKDLIVNAETVICRSGYSTLMDLYLLNKKKIVLIPTPGQTEQEYLAEHWKKFHGVEVYTQKEFGKSFKIH